MVELKLVNNVQTFVSHDNEKPVPAELLTKLNGLSKELFVVFPESRFVHPKTTEIICGYVGLGFSVAMFYDDVYVMNEKGGLAFWPSAFPIGSTRDDVVKHLDKQGSVDGLNNGVYEYLLNSYFHEGLTFGALPDGKGLFGVPKVGDEFFIFPTASNIRGLIEWVMLKGTGSFGPRGEFMYRLASQGYFGETITASFEEVKKAAGFEGHEVSKISALRSLANSAYFQKKKEAETAE